jgi:hypothetical protein
MLIIIIYHKLQASEDGKWPLATLDLIHTTIVEKLCQVTVRQEPKIGEPLTVNVLTNTSSVMSFHLMLCSFEVSIPLFFQCFKTQFIIEQLLERQVAAPV